MNGKNLKKIGQFCQDTPTDLQSTLARFKEGGKAGRWGEGTDHASRKITLVSRFIQYRIFHVITDPGNQ